MSFILPSLTYSYDALEPFLDEKTMKIHHTKHHQAYIDNANAALIDLPEFSNLPVIELIKKLNHLPNHKKTILRNNAGGHINHSLFWKYLKKNTILQGSLKDAIEYNFSSISSFKEHFEKTAISRFGSGWVWLIKHNNILSIVSTANQDNPLMGIDISGTNGYPILGLDVWEHAYYLKYQNRRLDYIRSFWNVVNWDEVYAQFNQV
ncbi:superoxide dismutase (Mn) [Candidatus Blochmanniella pennsylvanica str. BPEN]|uniref:Superoxide dismutase n=1 Tax=Blochmanniella pennsylvanica (strain BPEN) TaxID=291272 RepID=Q494B0_BLOPB|nr:Fe-Mn family superoxide dismutase [Candidatus Blochmannia pennsylvanicus]AAZ40671.1 superoxide dismutase (Mn) [Candidatus Blochmannia pennsylvanicus str. BPEN]UOY04460.1 superoxide dismutase [Mn] [Candidatus Blochmannia pennsylvanicus]